MATNSPKRAQRVKPKTYSTCLLYNTKEATAKLQGLVLAGCNPSSGIQKTKEDDMKDDQVSVVPDAQQLTVSETMSCNYCDATFEHRLHQKRHYRSDWHRYNLKQRLKGKERITEEQFEDISGNISSLSGSDSDSDVDSDSESQAKPGPGQRLPGSLSRHVHSAHTSSTDSESDTGNQAEELARRLPKVYFKNKDGEMLSIYRCVLCHKKSHPSHNDELVTLATEMPDQMTWAIFMSGGGHFAGAVFQKNEMIAHKTFHRYVVRAKRGTAQGSRDSQGNAPKSAGASLRRYNEAMLTQEVQDLILSWSEHLQKCDRIFLRAPSFNRKIFYGGKTPPFNKDDTRIRLVPFQTRRPTHNEVRRVYEMLASIECYGDETDLQDLIPISPPQVFNPETGQLTPRDENQLSPRQRKLINKKLGKSPLVTESTQAPSDSDDKDRKEPVTLPSKHFLPDHVCEEDNMSSSTASDTELVETMATINFAELKEYSFSKKPKKKKKSARKRSSPRRQPEPESNIMDEEKYHLKNSLYTACKTGDKADLKNLLAVFFTIQPAPIGTANSVFLKRDIIIERQSRQAAKNPVEINDIHISDSIETVEIGNLEEATNGTVQVKMDNVEVATHKTIQIEMDNLEKAMNETIQIKMDNLEEATNETVQVKMDNLEKEKETNETVKTGCDVVNESESVKGSIETVQGKVEKDNDIDETVKERQCDPIKETTPVKDISVKSGEIKLPMSNEESGNVNIESEKKLKETTDDEDTIKEDNAVASDKEESSVITENDNIKGTDVDKTDQKEKTDQSVTSKQSLELKSTTKSVSKPALTVDMSPVVTVEMLSEPFGDNSTTLLHVAAREGHGAVVTMLMEAGANPALRDKNGHTPYMVSKDKPTRNEFRRFMNKWPDKYDYTTAQIPAPLTEEMENERKKKEAEKKKAQKKVKQEQQKVRRAEEEKQRAEDREKQRYLGLSDREKRAIAAEKRLVTQYTDKGADKPILSRCFQCGADMTGKVPFEYCDNKFCTSKCLQLHRKSQMKS